MRREGEGGGEETGGWGGGGAKSWLENIILKCDVDQKNYSTF